MYFLTTYNELVLYKYNLYKTYNTYNFYSPQSHSVYKYNLRGGAELLLKINK